MHDIRNGICPLCTHDEIVESKPGEFVSGGAEIPSFFTAESRWVLEGRNPRHGHGPLRYYMCRSCGYLQWFVEAPGDVPIKDNCETRLISGKGKKDSPYR